ncbi:MAG: hypothetical protein Q9183_005237, partial [Haloplaca sp. 2 TL-2023]
MRAHPAANVLGDTITTFFDSSNDTVKEALAGNVWTAGGYINAGTGQNFSSWSELYGPHTANGDLFTTTQRDNLSSVIFSEAEQGIIVYGFGNRSISSPQPFDAKNIVLLADGTCSAACAHFVELMHHQAGVRTVAAGGLPQAGPMQIPAGTRGAEPYSAFALDLDISFAASINATAAASLPTNRSIDFYITYAGFNLRDAVRKNDATPLQFQNEPADCRIFYTAPTVYNFENLWNYVIDAMWRNPSLCIAGSASRFEPSTASNSPAAPPPQLSERSPKPIIPNIPPSTTTVEERAVIDPGSSTVCPRCDTLRERCADVPVCRPGSGQTFIKKCLRKCSGFLNECPRDFFCAPPGRPVRGVCQPMQAAREARGCRGTGTRQLNPV